MRRMTVAVAQKRCTVEEFFSLARSMTGPSAWILFETARRAGIAPLASFDMNGVMEASRLVVFSGQGECRMEKAFGEREGRVRMIQCGDESGKTCFMREQSYLLRRGVGVTGSLVCREFFCPDECGMLRLHAECLADVREEKR